MHVWALGLSCETSAALGRNFGPPTLQDPTFSRFGPSNLLPSGPISPGPHPSGPLRGTLPPPDLPKFRSFFPLPVPFRSFSVSHCVSSHGILVVFEASVPTVHVWAHGRNPGGFCKMSRTIFAIDLPPIRLPKKSMTNYCKFCLYPEKSLEHNRTKFHGRRPPTFVTHCFWVVVCAAPDSAACCCFSCCLCSCCCCLCLLLLLGRRPSTPLPSHLCSV